MKYCEIDYDIKFIFTFMTLRLFTIFIRYHIKYFVRFLIIHLQKCHSFI